MVAEVGDAGRDVELRVASGGLRGPWRRSVTPSATRNPQLATTILPMKRLLPALALLVMATTASAKLEFIENDYTQAVTRARAKNVPIFVDAWAPW